MTDLRAAAEMALEALEKITRQFTKTPSSLKDSTARVNAHKAIEALRQALAQPEQSQTSGYAKKIESLIKERDELRQALAQDEQELVWCGCGDGIVANDEAMCGVCVMRLKDQIERMKAQLDQAPPSKPWVSLTVDEKLTSIWRDGSFHHGVEWAEAKLKEKNT